MSVFPYSYYRRKVQLQDKIDNLVPMKITSYEGVAKREVYDAAITHLKTERPAQLRYVYLCPINTPIAIDANRHKSTQIDTN